MIKKNLSVNIELSKQDYCLYLKGISNIEFLIINIHFLGIGNVRSKGF
jgi:hypothetical protein